MNIPVDHLALRHARATEERKGHLESRRTFEDG